MSQKHNKGCQKSEILEKPGVWQLKNLEFKKLKINLEFWTKITKFLAVFTCKVTRFELNTTNLTLK